MKVSFTIHIDGDNIDCKLLHTLFVNNGGVFTSKQLSVAVSKATKNAQMYMGEISTNSGWVKSKPQRKKK